jgi:hypothetical protein
MGSGKAAKMEGLRLSHRLLMGCAGHQNQHLIPLRDQMKDWGRSTNFDDDDDDDDDD